jgi:acyl phosphate:glycerol-3-phosphate acyltransferase
VIAPLVAFATIVAAYLLGAIPTGLIVARLRGIDIQRSGSGNIGATNVLRSVGPTAAAFVMLVDPLKGVLAVAIPRALGLDAWWIAAAAIAAVLGNGYNAFLRFRGGKGVATSLGVFLMLDPWVTLVAVAIFALTAAFGRMVSLASLVAMGSAPLMLLILERAPLPTLIVAFVLASLAVLRHRDNLQRLADGTERRLGRTRPRPNATVTERDRDRTRP